jgi:hypothetical protein
VFDSFVSVMAHLKMKLSPGDLVLHLEMWLLIWECGCSFGDVVAHLVV